jgi:UDP-2,3-diacylglucosamine pyrophosphatase LpxH
LARRASKTERRAGEPPEKQYARSESLKAWAEEKLRAEPDLDLVVLGHTHLPVLLEVGPGRHYLNAGDWVMNKSYAVMPETEPPRLWDWREGSGEARASSAAER